MDGLVYPNRRVHTGLLEHKNVFRPVRVMSFDKSSGEAVIRNYMDFVDLKDYVDMYYEVTCDGEVVETGKVEVPSVLPHQEKTVKAAYETPVKGKCFVRLIVTAKAASHWVPAGYELGFDEIQISDLQKNTKTEELLKVVKATEAAPEVTEDDRFIYVTSLCLYL